MNNNKQIPKYRSLTREFVESLIEFNNQQCLSLYIPIVKTSSEHDKNETRLKNQLKKAEKELYLSTNEEVAKAILTPVYKLINNKIEWGQLQNGFVIFSNKDFQCYTSTLHEIPETIEISNSFYTLPLMNVFEPDNTNFYIVQLNQKRSEIYFCDESVYEKTENEGMPNSIEDVVGYDFEQKNLQHRTGQNHSGKSIFHGHGDAKDDKQKEQDRYLQEVSKYLRKLSAINHYPIIIAADDTIFHKLIHFNNNPHIIEENISGNTMDLNLNDLHKRSIEIMYNYRVKKNMYDPEHFSMLKQKGKATSNINQAYRASSEGRVEKTFITEKSRKKESHEPQAKMLDLISKMTIKNSGELIFQPERAMPDKNSCVNSIMRY